MGRSVERPFIMQRMMLVEEKSYEVMIDEMVVYIVAEAKKEHLMIDHEAVELIFHLQQEYIHRFAKEVSDEQ